MDSSDWVSSANGRALDFDGVNDRVEISPKIQLDLGSLNRTVIIWLNLRSNKQNPNNSAPIDFGKAGVSGNLQWWGCGIGSTGVAKFYWFSGSLNLLSGTTVSSLNTWNMVAASLTGNVSLYLNNRLENTVTRTVVSTDTGTPYLIGNAIGYATDGQIGDVAILGYGLSGAEISRLYELGPHGLGRLVIQQDRKANIFDAQSGSKRRRILTGMP
jgi:hypothetical protein